jgi:hypothetical protein
MATALSRPVPTNFWIRPDINEEYTLDDKLLYIYLITNEHFQQHAIYRLSKNMMRVELGMDKDRFNQAFNNLENKFRAIKYSEKTKEVAILDYYSFGILKGGKPLNDCFENLGKKVDDFTLLKAIYERSLNIIDDREAFKTVMKMVGDKLESVGLLGENSESANNSELKPQFIDDDDLPF